MIRVRLIIYIHQDQWYRKLVPSSHQRGKPSHTILYTFSGGNNWIWKGIQISDCLREKWAFVNVSSCSGGLKSQWVTISTVPNWGIRLSVGMLATLFTPLYKRISRLSLLFFLRDSHFSFSSMPVILPVWFKHILFHKVYMSQILCCENTNKGSERKQWCLFSSFPYIITAVRRRRRSYSELMELYLNNCTYAVKQTIQTKFCNKFQVLRLLCQYKMV